MRMFTGKAKAFLKMIPKPIMKVISKIGHDIFGIVTKSLSPDLKAHRTKMCMLKRITLTLTTP